MKNSPLDSKKQEDLLVYLVNNRKKKFDLEDCQEVYSTKKNAKQALKTLKTHGFVEKTVGVGQYKLLGIPEGLKSRVKLP